MYTNTNLWKHTVITPRAPNVVFVTNHETTPPDDLVSYLNGVVLDITLLAAKQRPAWKFYVVKPGLNVISAQTTIWNEQEKLGTLAMELYYTREGGSAYRASIQCPALSRNMARKNAMASKDPKKVLKSLLDNCRETPQAEMYLQKLNNMQQALRSKFIQDAAYSVDKDLDPNVVFGFLQSRGLWQEFYVAAVNEGAPMEFARLMEKKTAKKKAADVFTAASNSGQVFSARPCGEDFWVLPVRISSRVASAVGDLTLYVKDRHTDEFKTNIGILKLAPENTYIEGVGMRQSDDTDSTPAFCVMLDGGLG